MLPQRASLKTSVIFSSFFVLTLPLIIYSIVTSASIDNSLIIRLYFIFFGFTHFCLTPFLYLQNDNVAYFTSSIKKIFIYVVVPILIVVTFSILRITTIRDEYPWIDTALTTFILSFNFYHWSRQCFGILQILKKIDVKTDSFLILIENMHFILLSIAMIITYLSGGEFSFQNFYYAPVLVLFAITSITLLLKNYRISSKLLCGPNIYILLQSTAGLLTIYRTQFYIAALAMHYIEYHLVMHTRLFKVSLSDVGLDKIFSILRKSQVIFYLILFNMACLAAYCISTTKMHPPVAFNLFLSIFDGLFVFHFYIEMFVWKFSDPFYKKSIGPLFPKAPLNG